jgi:hypothetical protein
MAIRCEYHSNGAATDALNALDVMAANDGQAVPLFERGGWFARLHALCLGDRAALVAQAHDAGGTTTLPLMHAAPGHLVALANWYSFRWQPLNPASARLAALAHGLKAQASRLTLAPVPSEGGVADALVDALRGAGWWVVATETGTNHWLDRGDRSFADWWAARPGALRSTVKRKGKTGAVDIALYQSFDADAWQAFEHVYAASWKPAESHPDFLCALARQPGLRLGIASIAGQPVAAQFWTHDAGISSIHKLAHIQGVEAHSPGTLLSHAMFSRVFNADQSTRIDFGTGDDGYKRDWMESSAPLLTIEAFDPKQPASWPHLARASASRLAARLRRR